ncbi:MAG: cytochrome c oxidase assembly protein [Planctomycetia bacterium]|nr:cytochrome c oxidase assembly protein [Planctomycetia bacterium]
MDPNLVLFLRSWPVAVVPVAACALAAAIYLRGWRALRRRGSVEFGGGELAAFFAGLTAVLLAVSSPLEPFSDLLLSVHMAQHLLLMIAAPALLWLGAPQLPLVHGMPAAVLEYWVMPFLRWPPVRSAVRAVTNPVGAWLAATVVVWTWHVPRFFDLALRSNFWHHIEHACFLAGALAFWWPVIQPYPSRPVWPRIAVLPYVFLAAMQATVLCALLTFSDHVIYPHYEAVPRLWGVTAVTDQAIAGAMMWVVGTIAYLVPLDWIGWGLLFDRPRPARLSSALPILYPKSTERRDACAPSRRAPTFDLLQMPLVGRWLRWRPARRAMQAAFFLLAAWIILDGLSGPQIAPLNLAGVLPWVHWRGLVVLMLLVAGNFFCMACPVTLPRAIVRRVWTPRWDWPSWLRSKWLATGLLLAFFWAYEALDLWSSPWWTAWIAVGYFVVGCAVDTLFRGAAFCKYVCPVGQFQFVQSLVSPLVVRVREPACCTTCHTRECIQGGATSRGCEMNLLVPRKRDNLDCTFCLDCVHACPHDNVGLLAAVPSTALADVRSGRRATQRPLRADVAALMLLLVFAAFANAAGMIAPVVDAIDVICARFALPRPLVESGYLAVALVVAPCGLLVTAAFASRWASAESTGQLIARFAPALVPLGAAMWLAHYGFHLVTGASAFLPAARRFAADWGIAPDGIGRTMYRCCAAEAAPWLLRAEIVCLDFGFLAALYLCYRLATARCDDRSPAAKTCLPWCTLTAGLFLLGVWILCQPMEMRGAVSPGGAG